MSIKYKILIDYIKDLSVETPDAQSLLVAREYISKYSLNLNISSKALKKNMIEVYTKLVYEDKIKNKKNKTRSKKTHFEMIYATVISIEDENPNHSWCVKRPSSSFQSIEHKQRSQRKRQSDA